MGTKSLVSTIFILSLILSITQVQSAEYQQGFISVEIYNKGIDFAKDLVINTVIGSLTPLEVPPIEKPVKIALIGTVHITLSNIILYKIEVSNSMVEIGDSGVTVVASGTKASLSMDWSYHYGSFIKISDKGTASVEVEGMEVGVTVDAKNENGTIILSLLDCGCYVKDISIKMNGGASWLYQGLIDAFEGKIRSTIEDTITQKIKDEITDSESSLESIPKNVKIDDIATLNVTVVNGLVFYNNSIGFDIDGLFTSTRAQVAFSNYYQQNLRDSVQCDGPPKMLGISIHEEVFKSASLIYYNTDLMHWIVDNLPNKSLLNTAEWKYIIPMLYKKYPNDDIKLNVSVTSPPNIKVARENIDVAINLDVTVEVVDGGEVIPVACISSVVNLSAYPEISRNSLAGSITIDNFSMSLEWTKIGPLHIYLLKPVVATVLRTIVAPYVNLILYKGISLPNFEGYTLRNARFNYISPRIIVCSDVASLERRGLYPRMVSDT